MSVPEWVAALLKIGFDLLSGAITHDEAKTRAAKLAAADAVVDELEREKLG